MDDVLRTVRRFPEFNKAIRCVRVIRHTVHPLILALVPPPGEVHAIILPAIQGRAFSPRRTHAYIEMRAFVHTHV